MPKSKPTAETVELGRRIRAARIAAGFTSQNSAAAAMGVNREIMNKIETGRRTPGAPLLMRLILNLRLDPLQIFPEAAAWVGRSPEDRWPEGHPEAAYKLTLKKVWPIPEGAAASSSRWPKGYTITAADIANGDPEDQG